MKEQLITFDTAKLAKEKGFKIQCKKGFDYTSDSDGLKAYSFNGKIINDESVKNLFARPTQSLLQKWLREKYNIYVVPCPHRKVKVLCDVYDFSKEKNGYTNIEGISGNSWEEALEIGLQEALKLIK